MKNLLFTAMLCIASSPFVFAQTDSLHLHSGGSVVFTIAEEDLDSITIYRAAHALPAVQTHMPKDVSLTTTTVGITVVDKGVPVYTEMGVCYDTLPNPDITKACMRFGQTPGDTAEITLQYLKSEKTYYVRAYATNATGTVYGIQETFTTTNSLKTSIFGIVTDLDNNPVVGALVKVENTSLQNIYTDENGVYYFPDVTLTQSASLTFTKPGFLEATRKNNLVDNGSLLINAKMIPSRSRISTDTTINSIDALALTFAEGKAKVDIPANAYVDAANAPYTGPVKIQASYLDPTDTLFSLLIPGGDMTASRTNNDFVYLYSLGIINVELSKPTGEKLQLNGSALATLTAKIPDSLKSEADATIPMWWYDNEAGLWKEQGIGTKTGNDFVAQVSHFTYWNYDYYCPYPVTIKGRITGANGNPVAGVQVQLGWEGIVQTNSNGEYIGTFNKGCTTNGQYAAVRLIIPGLTEYYFNNVSYVKITQGQTAILDFILPKACEIRGIVSACDVVQNDAVIYLMDDSRWYPYLPIKTTNGSYIYSFYSKTGTNYVLSVTAVEPLSGKVLIYNESIDVSGCPNIITHNVDMGCDTADDGAADVTDCANQNLSLGTIGFETASVWVVPAANGAPQTIWSDAVIAEDCSNKTDFYVGGYRGAVIGTDTLYYSDCRSNPGYPGDLFSLCAVARYGHVLCPAPWRVPTAQDFFNLDKALGGTGANSTVNASLAKYLDPVIWGGTYSGSCMNELDHGELMGQGEDSYYWSSDVSVNANGFLSSTALYYAKKGTDVNIYPQYTAFASYGGSLRCVRD